MQNEQIDSALRTQGGHLTVGHGEYTLHFARGSTLSGYDCEAMKAICHARGVPIIDYRPIPIDILTVAILRNPVVAVGAKPDREPWGPLSEAPLSELGRRYRDLGADVLNMSMDHLSLTCSSQEA